MPEILIGTDPELFVTDEHDRFISAHDLIPGSKEFPHPVPRGAIQVDGVAAEFNIDPVSKVDQFTKNIRSVMNSMEEYIKEKHPSYNLHIAPTAHFERAYFDLLPEETKKLGCTPDFDCYTGEENMPPETTESFRTGAGHIHIGWTRDASLGDEKHFKNCCDLVKELDATLFPASLLWDNDNKRRELYGKMGSFRPKPYGLEYRPLSNAYLKEKSTQEFVFNTSMYVAQLFFGTGTRVKNDKLAQRFVEDTLLDREMGQLGINKYLGYMGEKYGIPILHR
jgi:hypothetical protein